MRNGIRSAKRFINADRVEVRRLTAIHVNERQKEAKALSARIDGADQRDGHHSSETGVFGQDLGGLEAFMEGASFVD
jgi:hypothetical protein